MERVNGLSIDAFRRNTVDTKENEDNGFGFSSSQREESGLGKGETGIICDILIHLQDELVDQRDGALHFQIRRDSRKIGVNQGEDALG